MFKKAEEYTTEELLENCREYVWGVWWSFYKAARDVVGKEKANEIVAEYGKVSVKGLGEYMRELLGKDFENVEEMANCIDVMHRVLGYTAPWTFETKLKGYEKVSNCRQYNATPEEFKGEGICKIYCIPAGEALYPNLHPSRPKVTRDKFITDGEPYCGIKVEMEEP